jgi:hypothetical protein
VLRTIVDSTCGSLAEPAFLLKREIMLLILSLLRYSEMATLLITIVKPKAGACLG